MKLKYKVAAVHELKKTLISSAELQNSSKKQTEK